MQPEKFLASAGDEKRQGYIAVVQSVGFLRPITNIDVFLCKYFFCNLFIIKSSFCCPLCRIQQNAPNISNL